MSATPPAAPPTGVPADGPGADRWRALSLLAPVGIFETDAEGACTFVNERWVAISGLEPDAALGFGWMEAIHGEDRVRVVHEWQRTAAAGGELLLEYRIRPPGRPVVWVRGAAVALRDAEGAITGFLGTITDITDLKRAEAERERALAEERDARQQAAAQFERLSRLIAALGHAVLVEDENRTIVLVNQAFCDLFAIPAPPEALVGSDCSGAAEQSKHLLVDPDGFVARIAEILAVRHPATDEVAFADGRVAERDYLPIFVADDDRGHLWMYRDITDRKAVEVQRERLLAAELHARQVAESGRARLAEQNERLRQLDALKTEFLATVSHELGTPLTSITSFVDLLRGSDPPLPDEAAGFVDVIGRNAARLRRLVDDLLLLARLETRSVPLDPRPTALDELVAEAVADHRPTAAARGVDLELHAAPGPPADVDPLRIRQVVDNLVANAVKFTPEGGAVAVRVEPERHRWRIAVSDTGVGMSPDDLEHVFDRFHRADGARRDGIPGTGLGLSITKAIVDLHGGQIVVRSAPDEGTTVVVTLPGVADTPAPTPGATPTPEPDDGADRR